MNSRHIGNMSMLKNIRDIISRPMEITFNMFPSWRIYRWILEDVKVSAMECLFEECRLNIQSASLKFHTVLLSVPPRMRVESYPMPKFKANVYIRERGVNGRYSLVMQPAAYSQSDDTRLSSCLQDPKFLQRKHCVTLVFERTLRDIPAFSLRLGLLLIFNKFDRSLLGMHP